MPIIFIMGHPDIDWMVGTGAGSAAERIATYLNEEKGANIKVVYMEQAGHQVFLDHPESFCKIVRHFIEERRFRPSVDQRYCQIYNENMN